MGYPSKHRPRSRFTPTPEQLAEEQGQAPWMAREPLYKQKLLEAYDHLFLHYKAAHYRIQLNLAPQWTEYVDTAAVDAQGRCYFNPYFLDLAGWDDRKCDLILAQAGMTRAQLDAMLAARQRPERVGPYSWDEFVDACAKPLTPPQIAFVLYHENRHIELDSFNHHPLLNPKLVNIAQDHQINWEAYDLGLEVIDNPGFRVHQDPRFRGKWWLDIYYILEEEIREQQQQSPQQGQGSPQQGQGSPQQGQGSPQQGQGSPQQGQGSPQQGQGSSQQGEGSPQQSQDSGQPGGGSSSGSQGSSESESNSGNASGSGDSQESSQPSKPSDSSGSSGQEKNSGKEEQGDLFGGGGTSDAQSDRDPNETQGASGQGSAPSESEDSASKKEGQGKGSGQDDDAAPTPDSKGPGEGESEEQAESEGKAADKKDPSSTQSSEGASEEAGDEPARPDYSQDETRDRVNRWRKGERGGIGTDKEDCDFGATEDLDWKLDPETVEERFQASRSLPGGEKQAGQGSSRSQGRGRSGTYEKVEIDWEYEIMRRVTQMYSQEDIDWTRMHQYMLPVAKRQKQATGHMPMYADDVKVNPSLIIGVDCSGSMDDSILKAIERQMVVMLGVGLGSEERPFEQINFTDRVVSHSKVWDRSGIKFGHTGGTSVLDFFDRLRYDPDQVPVGTRYKEDDLNPLLRRQSPIGLVLIFTDAVIMPKDWPKEPPEYADKVVVVRTDPRYQWPMPPWILPENVIDMYPPLEASPYHLAQQQLASQEVQEQPQPPARRKIR